MTTRTLPATAAALSVAAALLLTACGGGGDSKDPDKIKGVDHSTAPSTASSSAPATSSVQRPVIQLPSDDVLVFEDSSVDDPKKTAVLNDNKEFIRATDDAIIRAVPASEALKFYSKGDALKVSVDWVKSFVKTGQSVTGTVRYYNRQVTFLKDGSAALTYCGNETKAFNKDRKTGKRSNGVSSSADAYVSYNVRLEKNSQGIWQAVQMLSNRGKQKCRS